MEPLLVKTNNSPPDGQAGASNKARTIPHTLFMRVDNWSAWCFIPQLMIRVQRFSEIYGETDGATLMRAYMTSFIHQPNNPQIIAYIGYNDSSEVVAHVLISVAEWYGKRTACVIQYAVDDGWHLSPRQWATIWSEIRAWAIKQKCQELTAHVAYDSPLRVRAFRTFYKMVPKDIVLSMDLSREPETCESLDE